MRKIPYKLKLFLTTIFFVGSIVNGVIITIYNVDKSSKIEKVTDHSQEIISNCNKLSEAVSQGDSLFNFYEKSHEYGYMEAVEVFYFNQSDFVAQVR